MRDPKRIEDFLVDLYLLWSLYPDLRFGQLVDNLIPQYDGIKGCDLRMVEDDIMLSFIHKQLGITK